jgi:hypothetical protein
MGQPGQAHAHPLLTGQWVVSTPPAGFMAFTFGPGQHIGNGVWRGPFSYNVSNVSVVYGTYELRMFTGHQGTFMTEANHSCMSFRVGIVDLRNQVVNWSNTDYRRPVPIVAPFPVMPPAPSAAAAPEDK